MNRYCENGVKMKKFQLYNELKELISYIEKNLLEINSIDECLERTFLSKYHLMHVFKQITGGTVMDYVQGRKMAKSLHDLLETDLRVIDISVKYGYTHEQSFIRAFKKFFGITPASYRRNPKALKVKHPIEMKGFFELNDGVILQPRYVHLPSMNLVGMKHYIQGDESVTKGTGRNVGYDFFFHQSHKVENPVDPQVYIGHTWHENGDMMNSYYLPSLEVKEFGNIPQGMYCKKIEACDWVVFTYIGRHHATEVTIMDLLSIHNYVQQEFHEKECINEDSFFFEKIDTSISAKDYCEVEIYFRIN